MLRHGFRTAADADRTERGAVALEFALGVTIFLVFVFGIIEVGRAIWIGQALSAASREAARYGVGNETSSGVPQYLDCAGIRAAARERVPDLVLTDADISVTFRHTDGSTSTCEAPAPVHDGDRIVVQVTTKLDIDLPLVPLGDNTLSASDERSIYTGVSP
jgi:Flp pilus assembly protein TadG